MQEKKEQTRILLEVEQESNLKLGIQVDLGLKTIPSNIQLPIRTWQILAHVKASQINTLTFQKQTQETLIILPKIPAKVQIG